MAAWLLKHRVKSGIALILFLSAALSSHAANLGRPSIEALVHQVEDVRKSHAITAAGLILFNNGELIYADGLGFLSQRRSKEFTKESVIRIGSITKSITAIAALQLNERQQLSLDEPVNPHIPRQWQGHPWSTAQTVTVAQLLEHTAGFKELSQAEFHLQNDQFLPLLDVLSNHYTEHKHRWPVGQHHSYTNLGAAYAGLVIEQASGSSYEEFVEKNIFQPLGMNHSGFFLADSDRENFVLGYDRDGKTPIPYWHMAYRPFGGMNTTLEDMARYLKMFLGAGMGENGRVLTPASLERMQTPKTSLAARSGLTYGYGLGLYQWLNSGVLFYGHGGDADGYLARFGFAPEHGIAYFHVINAFNHKAHWEINELIEDYLLQGFQAEKFPERYPLSQQQLAGLVGQYKQITARFGEPRQPLLAIEREGDTLYTRRGSARRELIPVSPNHFRRRNETLATIAIIGDSDGNLIFQGDIGNFKKE